MLNSPEIGFLIALLIAVAGAFALGYRIGVKNAVSLSFRRGVFLGVACVVAGILVALAPKLGVPVPISIALILACFFGNGLIIGQTQHRIRTIRVEIAERYHPNQKRGN